MFPILFIAIQLGVLALIFVKRVAHNPSSLYRVLYLAAFLGVIGFDIWYLADYAYPTGFAF